MRVRYRLPKVDFPTFRALMRQLGPHLRSERGRLLGSGAAIVAVSGLTLLQPWPLTIVFDFVFLKGGGRKTPEALQFLNDLSSGTILGLAAASVLILAMLKGLFSYTHSVQSKVVGHKFVAEIRSRLFGHIQRLPQSYHDYRETGDVMTRLTSDVQLVKDLLVTTLLDISSQLLLVLGMLIVMFTMDPRLTLIALAMTPVYIFSAFRFTGRIKSSARKQREMYGKIVASMQESLAGISQIKGFSQEKAREKLIGKTMDRDVKANVRTTKLEANYSRSIEIVNAIGTCLILWLGANRVNEGYLTPGQLLVFLTYLRGIYKPLLRVARLTSKASKATARGEKILEILEMRTEVEDRPNAVSAKGIQGDVRFENVSFSYANGRAVLHGVTCRIPANKTTMILGATGVGKSTFAKLIMRLYEPQVGQILLDDRDITDYRIASLRKRITPLAQEPFLFRMSIAENIGFGKRHSSREEIEEAARLVGAHDFIVTLPQGYDTLVGEMGLTLSGGQRQRISFARAAIRKSPVMIFDEPATGLDVHAEAHAKEVLQSLSVGRTFLVITHRLHFLEIADWIIFMENGRVVEEGRVTDLMERQGSFHRFVTSGDQGLDYSEWLAEQSEEL